MIPRNSALFHKRFFIEIVIVFLSITIVSSYLQYILLSEQKDNQINVEATMIAKSIQEGIKTTELGSQTIEHQIDIRLIMTAQLIAQRLQGKELQFVANEELEQIRGQLGLSGITLFAKAEEGIKGVRATDPKEVGFSFKKFGLDTVAEDLLNGKKPELDGAYTDTNIVALPVAQSASHTDQPTFFKYVYYHPPGTPYVISIYTEANEIYQLTKKVGAEWWIQNFYKENPYIKEIGVLNLRIIQDPTLETNIYPLMKKIEYGSFQYQSSEDIKLLKSWQGSSEKIILLQDNAVGEKIYKIFLPMDENHVVYISFDYKKMNQFLYGNSKIQLISVLISLFALLILTIRFFKKAKQTEDKINFMAYHDELTNLPNRRKLKEKLSEFVNLPKNKPNMALFYMDIDNFKFINDTFGHQSGDILIKIVAQRINAVLSPNEVIARIGGDEFIVVIPTFTDAKEVMDKAQKILDSFIPSFHMDTQEIFVKLSIGISFYPSDGEDLDELIQYADTAMYYAKKRGKNNFQLYTPVMKDQFSQNVMLEKELRLAVEKQEFILHYQPKINIATGSIIGVEALIRWNHPEKGMISPLDFIPYAEENGLIIPIGEWVLKEAVSQMKKWRELGAPKLIVGINLSSRQFFNENMLYEIRECLSISGIAPGDLELEITESTIMEQPEATIKTIKELKKLGIRISMDDFGTGYSSLSYLKKIPIDTLKIDRSFVSDINKGTMDNEIIHTIISLGKSLGLEVIAEGVETKQQLETLRKFGCDHVQGYLFGKPLPIEEFEKLLKGMEDASI